MKAEEFRGMGEPALRTEMETRKKELLEQRCQVALGEEVHPHMIRNLKKDIARMNTVLTEKAVAGKGDK
jgi:large subunit ribosomal protein L29